MKRRRTTIRILLLSAVLLFVWVLGVVSVNHRFPRGMIEVYDFGEVFPCQGAEMLVTGGEFLDSTEVDMSSLSSLKISSEEGLKGLRVIVVDVEVSNTSEEKITLNLISLSLESNEFSMRFFAPLVSDYNTVGMFVDLDSGEKKQLRLPVVANKILFNEPAKVNFEERQYFLVSSLYPYKKMAKIPFV